MLHLHQEEQSVNHRKPRLEWDDYFMEICAVVAQRSTCARAAVGAVIVRDRNILATGYNGAPAGMPHCTESGCLVYTSTNPSGETEENCYRTIHAEINAIAQAAKSGVSIKDSRIYITHSPCIQCLKVLVNTGVGRICYGRPYKLDQVRELIEGSGVIMEHIAPIEVSAD